MHPRLTQLLAVCVALLGCRDWDGALLRLDGGATIDAGSSSTDAGSADAGVTDAGTTDAGTTDAGPPSLRLLAALSRGANQTGPQVLPDGGALVVVLHSYQLWRYAGGSWSQLFDNPPEGFDAVVGDPDTLIAALDSQGHPRRLTVYDRQTAVGSTETCGYPTQDVGWNLDALALSA
ncbi:MAG: hypothetical protein JNG84_02660, partial [Archangium sp.]|nr:hypothetical protein [Archangium sp.]